MYGNFQGDHGVDGQNPALFSPLFGPSSLPGSYVHPFHPCPPKNRAFCQGLSSSLANKKRGMDEEDQERSKAKCLSNEKRAPVGMFRLFLGDEVSYQVVLGLFDKPWNKDAYSPTRIQWMLYPRVWICSLQGQTHTQAPHPRKLTAKTTLKNDAWWPEDKPFLLSHVFFGGDLFWTFLGWHLGHCVFFLIFVLFLLSCFSKEKGLRDFGTSTLTIHFFKKPSKQSDGFASGSWVF